MRSKLNLLMIIISLAVLVLLIVYANPPMVFDSILRADVFYVSLAFLFSLIAIILQAYKWKILVKDVKFKKIFPVQMLGIALNNLSPGKAAEPLKAAFLKQYTGKPVSETLSSIMWERVFDILVILSFALFAVSYFSGGLLIYSIAGMCVLVALIVLLVLIMFSRRVGGAVFKLIVRLPFLKLSGGFLKNFYKTRISNERIFLSFIFSILIWSLYGVSFYFSMLSVGVSLPVNILTGVMCLSIIIGVVTTLPGGIGSSDVVMAVLLGLMGVQSSVAVSGVLIARLLSVWFGVFLGFVSFIYLSKRIDIEKLLS